MKKIVFTIGLLVIVALVFASAKAIPVFAGGQSGNSSKTEKKQDYTILVIDRDVPQTRVGFEPVVNHEAMVVNLSDEAVTVEIESPIPPGLYVVKKFFPTFGNDSLLSLPMQFPEKIAISDYKILERPDIDKKNNTTVFRWKNVVIQPKHAAIAQYDNYLGPRSQFYTREGMRILGLDIRSTYKASVIDGGKAVVFELYYDIENPGQDEVQSLLMDLIVPDKVFKEDEEVPVNLFEVTDAVASPEVTIMRGLLGDGSGKPAEGTIFTFMAESLKPGKSVSFWMKVIGKNMAREGSSYPILSFQGRTDGNPIWLRTEVKSKEKLNVKRYSYRYANLVIPDKRLFRFGPSGVSVEVEGVDNDDKKRQ